MAFLGAGLRHTWTQTYPSSSRARHAAQINRPLGFCLFSALSTLLHRHTWNFRLHSNIKMLFKDMCYCLCLFCLYLTTSYCASFSALPHFCLHLFEVATALSADSWLVNWKVAGLRPSCQTNCPSILIKLTLTLATLVCSAAVQLRGVSSDDPSSSFLFEVISGSVWLVSGRFVSSRPFQFIWTVCELVRCFFIVGLGLGLGLAVGVPAAVL